MGLNRWILAALVVVASLAATDASAQNRREPATGDPVTVVACVARQGDYVRTSAPSSESPLSQVLLTSTTSGAPTYGVRGLREADLLQHAGFRVEAIGTVEKPRTTPVVTTAEGAVTGSVNNERSPAAGITPDGAAAHEPSDALSATVSTGKAAEPRRTSDPAYAIAMLPGLNVTTFRRVSGRCPTPAGQEQAASADSTPAPRAPILASPASSQAGGARADDEVVVARGCLVRQTPGGTALTPQVSPTDVYVLSNATLVQQKEVAGRGAVPGSTRADAGSGTVPAVAGTTGTAPVDAATQSFRLDVSGTEVRQLTAHIGDRVEVTGVIGPAPATGTAAGQESATLGPGRVQVAPIEVAHVSTPVRRIQVSAFRALGGACN